MRIRIGVGLVVACVLGGAAGWYAGHRPAPDVSAREEKLSGQLQDCEAKIPR